MITSKKFRLGFEDFISSLDELGISDNAVFVFSPYKKLISSYNGYAVEVRRSSDDAYMNFGFDKWGNLEKTKLLNWIGSGNNGYVRTVYNQAKPSNNISQATANGQPMIVDSGVFLEDGLDFDGSFDFMGCAKYDEMSITDHPLTMFAQFKVAAANTGYLLGINTDSSNTQYSMYTTTVPQVINWKLSPSVVVNSDYSPGVIENVMGVYKDGGTNAQISKSNSDEDTGNYSSILTEYNFVNIGCRSTNSTNTSHSAYLDGNIKTIIIFNSNEYDNYSNLVSLI